MKSTKGTSVNILVSNILDKWNEFWWHWFKHRVTWLRPQKILISWDS